MNTELIVRQLIKALVGEEANRHGLEDTPKRYAALFKSFLNPEPFTFTTFIEPGADEMVIVHDIPFYSFCEHHIIPFFGVGHIAYIPQHNKIVGLSKIPRVLDMFARRLQNQERIGKQVADYLMEHLQPAGVAVVLRARHLCVEMRGVEKPGTVTTTSAMRGRFKENINTRNEFLNLIK